MKTISVKSFDFGPVVQNSLVDISYLELCNPFSAEQYHLWNFGRGYHEEHFCEFIFNLDQWFRSRHHLNTFLI